MNLFIDKDIRKFIVSLILTLFIGIILIQIITYVNTIHFKNEIIRHDYELAGYLIDKYPNMDVEIQSLFTKEKTNDNYQKGKKLLEKSGFNENMEMFLIPQIDNYYNTNRFISFVFSIVFSLIVVFIVYIFLKAYTDKINKYSRDVNKIMNGEIATRLADNDEGNLAKLATSINLMATSLHTHIEKEKGNRIFLKNIITNISHQLKTPLSALTMYNEIMKDENVNNEVINDFLNKSENELNRIQILISNLLKLAKLDAGIIVLNKNSHVLNDIINKVVKSFETRAIIEQKTIEIKSKSSVTYFCDRVWMLEVLSNLVKNALEHTTEGNNILLEIEETPLMIKIIVSDNGKGIHPDDINHIFKRFYRSRFSQNKQGTGVGLTLAKSIVEMHGGFISVQSTIEKGTTFIVHLPKLTDL